MTPNLFRIDTNAIRGSPIIAVGSELLISSKRLIPKPSDFIHPTQLNGFS